MWGSLRLAPIIKRNARLYTHILHELLVGVAMGIGWAWHELLVILSINY